MSKTLISAVFVASLLLIGAGCGLPSVPTQPTSPAPKPAVASFGVPAYLKIGSSVTYDDGLEVVLEKINDSRCPKGVQCIWQGELAPILQLQGGELGNAPQELSLGTVRAPKQTLGGYAFELDAATASSITLLASKPDGRAPVTKTPPSGVICTMEAKQCPDGSYVGRTGPNCEFAPCP